MTTIEVMRKALCAAVVFLVGCADQTQPEDIALAQDLCSSRGGYASVSRFERGKNIIINCNDGTHLDVRLHGVEK